MRKSIYLKLVLIFIGIFIFGNAASFMITSLTTENSIMGQLESRIEDTLSSTAQVYQSGKLDAADIEKLFSSDFISIKVYENKQELKTAYPLSDSEISQISTKTKVFLFKKKDDKDGAIGIIKSGNIYLVAKPAVNDLVVYIRDIILRTSFMSLVLGSLVMIIAAGFLISPIRKLSFATSKIAKGEFDIHIDDKRSDEIGRLINDFNLMAKELSGMEIMRNDFISNISHEFKTPITSIEGYTKLLRGCNDENDRNEYIDIIIDETRRLSNLSGNILLLNKIENENIPFAKKNFRLDEQIRKMLNTTENKWNAKNIDLQLDLDNLSYSGNEQLLYQVWLNLFDNAVRYSGKGGTIEISLKEKDGKKIFSVTDFGKGLSEEDKKRMFEKFYTGDKSRGSEGNGLGLSIVRRIVDMHSGAIKVESRQGEFTCIKVIL